MLQGALIKFDKTVLLRKICYRNGLIMCIVIHETRHHNKYGLSINNHLFISFNHYLIIYYLPLTEK